MVWKMKPKKIAKKEIGIMLEEAIMRVCGKGSEVILKVLKDKKDVDEFKMASRLKMTVNQLRNLFYKLQDEDLVSSVRKKDKRKGWYIYYWTLEKERVFEFLLGEYKKERDGLKHVLASRKKKNFFECPNEHVEMSEETALEHNFECPECGELMLLKDEKSDVRRVNRRLVGTEKKISLLSEILKEFEVKLVKPKLKPRRRKRKRARMKRKPRRAKRAGGVRKSRARRKPRGVKSRKKPSKVRKAKPRKRRFVKSKKRR